VDTSDSIAAVIQRLQRRFVLLRRWALGLDVLLGGAAFCFLATVVIKLVGWSVPLLYVYGAIGAGALLVFLLLAWRVRISALNTLIQTDTTLKLQERLSTAYEYLQRYADNPFVPALVADATRLALRVDPRAVFAVRLPRRVWGVPVLLAAMVGFTLLDVAPLRLTHFGREEVSHEVMREGERLERWGQRLEQLAQQERLDRSLILARHMQELGRRLQREGGEAAHAAERISTLSQYLQRMQQELQERALMGDASAMTTQDVLASGKSVKQELHDILQLLQQDALPREMATVAEQGITRLSRRLGQNAELEQLVQNLRAGNLEAARRLLQDVIQQQQAAEELEHMERAQRALEYSSRTIQRGESEDQPAPGSADTGEASSSEGSQEFDPSMMSEDMPGMEDFAAPGMEEGFGVARNTREGSPRLLRESSQPISQVPVKSGEGTMRLSYVRYLPLQNEARESFDTAVTRYQHAAEEVLSQEQIPQLYREQIKQYFLAIGMVSERKQQ
jgi:hypothetical protein